jgi:hypothetical protein
MQFGPRSAAGAARTTSPNPSSGPRVVAALPARAEDHYQRPDQPQQPPRACEGGRADQRGQGDREQRYLTGCIYLGLAAAATFVPGERRR